MPTSFLSLPREIRDEIYKLVLLSPNGFVQMQLVSYGKDISPKPSGRTKGALKPVTFKRSAHKRPYNRSHFRLAHNPSNLRDFTDDGVSEIARSDYSTLSLLRVNRQLHHETRNLFWENTAFYFSAYQLPSTHFLTAVRCLKTMGQTASRLVAHVRLCMGKPESDSSCLRKVLQNLASRSRHGCFKKLELEWDAKDFIAHAITGAGEYHDGVGLKSYYEMLEDLRRGCETARFERIVMVRDVFGSNFDYTRWQGGIDREKLLETAKDIHHAVGGQFFVRETLLWDNFKKVGD